MSALGKNIKRVRLMLGLSQPQMAVKMGIKSHSLISKYELDQVEPSATTLQKIAVMGNMTVDCLLNGEESAGKFSAEDEYIRVPRYEVQAGAGPGITVQSEQIVDHLSYKAEWVRSLGVEPRKVVVVSAVGDSMVPAIQPDDLLFIDSRRKVVSASGGIYCFADGDDLSVKRMQLIKGVLIIRSDNTLYSEYRVDGDDINRIKIVGRVFWIGKKV